MGYIFARFNKLTYMLIIYIYVYIHIFVFAKKSWVFHGIQGHTPGVAHGCVP